MNLISLVKNVIITGKKALNILYLIVVIITWILIFCWIILNQGAHSINSNIQSTVNLKLRGPVVTNFTPDDFRPHYVSPEYMAYYSRVWDSADISIEKKNEIQIITNLVITPNQTRSLCPSHPDITGAICDPDNNHCTKGRDLYHGITTGKCVPGDFPYNNGSEWVYGHDCQIIAWCPVDRLYLPLLSSGVLQDTKNSTIWLKASILFTDYKINMDNEPNPDINYYIRCRYNPRTDPNCPVFILKDILKYSDNNNQDYETMARYGATIHMEVEWNCILPLFREFVSTKDCIIRYSFTRIDDEQRKPSTGYTSFIKRFMYERGRLRTMWRTRNLRILVKVKGDLKYIDWFRFFTLFSAYNGVFSLVLWIFSIGVKHYLQRRGLPIDETLDISDQTELFIDDDKDENDLDSNDDDNFDNENNIDNNIENIQIIES